VDDRPDSKVFAFEDALMYQPTRYAVAITTYSFNGPNDWTDGDPFLSAVPVFGRSSTWRAAAPGCYSVKEG